MHTLIRKLLVDFLLLEEVREYIINYIYREKFYIVAL